MLSLIKEIVHRFLCNDLLGVLYQNIALVILSDKDHIRQDFIDSISNRLENDEDHLSKCKGCRFHESKCYTGIIIRDLRFDCRVIKKIPFADSEVYISA
jgi:hypothetical protein